MNLNSQQDTGFEVFGGVFSNEEIVRLRKLATNILPVNTPPFKPQVVRNIFDKSYEIAKLILGNARVKDLISKVHGAEFVLLDEYVLQDSSFGGWHTDTTSPESNDYVFHLAEDFFCIQWAIYLQDNSVYGGGLSGKSGTHLLPDPFVKERNRSRLMNFIHTIRKKLENTLAINTANTPCLFAIPSRAGDLISFNVRLHHRSTPYQIEPKDETNRKLAVFFMTGTKNSSTFGFRDWLRTYRQENISGTRAVSEKFLKLLESENIEFLP